jgi:hypothetical protein
MAVDGAISTAASSLIPNAGFLKYAIYFIPLAVILGVIGTVFVLKKYNAKKYQWTHTLEVRRVLADGKTITETPSIHKMRRFNVMNGAEVFELENALLGSYLFPELDKYSGNNKFSIILDTNNRIYTANEMTWEKDLGSINVSAKHSEIDLARKRLKEDFQNINKVSKRIEWAEIAKWTFLFMAMIVVMVLGIVGLTKWGEAQDARATMAQSDVAMSANMVKVMETMESTVNTQKLEITAMLKQVLGTENLQGLINEDYTIGGS